jgi:hypothetical protein
MKAKQAWICALMSLALVLGVAGTSMSASFSGEFMFNETGNDPARDSADLDTFAKSIESWFLDEKGETRDINLEFYAKADAPSTAPTEGDGDLTVTYAEKDGERKSGTWTTGDPIDFYSVKAGNGYALYWMEGGATSGDWSTAHRDDKGISHLSTWLITSGGGNGGPGVEPIPEPSTVFLMGLGLVGVGVIVRKRAGK